jgi:hypothetical protein
MNTIWVRVLRAAAILSCGAWLAACGSASGMGAPAALLGASVHSTSPASDQASPGNANLGRVANATEDPGFYTVDGQGRVTLNKNALAIEGSTPPVELYGDMPVEGDVELDSSFARIANRHSL